MSVPLVSAKRKGETSEAPSQTGQLDNREVSLLGPPPSTTKCGKHNNTLCGLPNALLARILSFLPYTERVSVIPQTCRFFRGNKPSVAIEHVNTASGPITLQELLDCGLDFTPAKPIRLELQSLEKNPANQKYLDENGLIRPEVLNRIIAQWGPSIIELNFDQSCLPDPISKAGRMSLIAGCPRLEVLRIPKHLADPIDDGDLRSILQSCKDHLLVLDIDGCDSLTPAGLREISTCPHLRSLVASLTKLTDTELGSILTACPELSELNISHCELIKGDAFAGRSFPNLQKLMAYNTALTEEGFGLLLSACPMLEELDFSECSITGECFADKVLHHLQKLFVNGTDFIDEDLHHALSACPKLRELDIGDSAIEGTAFADKNLPHLQKICAAENALTDASLDFLLNACPSLRILELNKCEKLTGVGFNGKHNLTLEELSVTETAFTDEGLSHLLDACPGLQLVEVNECGQLTGTGFQNKDCSSLRSIYAGATALTDEGLSHLSKACPQLQELEISYCQHITDAGFADKRFPRLQRLDARETALRDEDLIFAACPMLRRPTIHNSEAADTESAD